MGTRDSARTADTSLRLTVAEAAKIAGVSQDQIRRWIRATEPPYLEAQRAGTKLLIKPEALEACLDSLPSA